MEFTVVKRENITFGDEDIMALIGKVEEFQENDNWIEYAERLEHYFTANEITDNGKKRAVLLSSCGAKTYKLIRNLVAPGKPTDKSFAELINIVKNHLNPRPSSMCIVSNSTAVLENKERQSSNTSLNCEVFRSIATFVISWKT